jgi:transposase
MRIKRIVLEHHGNVPMLGMHVIDELVVNPYATVGNFFQTGDHPKSPFEISGCTSCRVMANAGECGSMDIAMRLAEIEKKTKRYPTDLTDAEWLAIEPVLPRPAKTGRRRQTDLREILNAIRYMARSAGGWRMLPKDFPPWQTVYWWFRHFVRCLMFRTIHDVTLMLDRERTGREAEWRRADRRCHGRGWVASCRLLRR